MFRTRLIDTSALSVLRLHPHTACWIVWLCLPLLFLPKINLIGVAGQTAGLRIDDLVLLAVMMVLGIMGVVNRRRTFFIHELWLLGFVLLASLGTVLNNLPIGFVYTMRIIEYFVFFYIGLLAFAQNIKLSAVMERLVWFNAVLIVLQRYRLIGSFPLGTYEISGGVYGIGSGTWEIGLILNIAVATVVFTARPPSFWRCMALFAVTMVCMLWIGGRTPAMLQLMLLVVYLVRSARTSLTNFWLVLSGTAVMLGAVLLNIEQIGSSTLITRMASLFTLRNIDLMQFLWNNTVVEGSLNARYSEYLWQTNRNADYSLLIRMEKVFTALRYYTSQSEPWLWLVGTGPGRWGTAVDAGHVRLLTENGLLGAAALFGLVWQLLRGTLYGTLIFVIFLINMLTLDMYLAYKIMAMIMLIGGWNTAAQLSHTPMLQPCDSPYDDHALNPLFVRPDYAPDYADVAIAPVATP